jgi:CDP-diacylglycerol--serine O-phosphatidyltransferase
MIRVPRIIIPNFFTVGNMFSGFMSVLFSIYFHDYIWACWMIILGAFLDAMDGKVARLTNTASEFGVEYDSLADVVSFGLAPSALIYGLYFHHWALAGAFISFFPLLFGSIRLARFNVQLDGFDKSHFNGLPIPVAALTIVSYVMFMDRLFPGKIFPKLLLLVTFLVSVLMVSRIRYELLPKFSVSGKWSQKLFLGLFLFGVITAVFFPKILLFPYFVIYIFAGIIRFVVRIGQGKRLDKKNKKASFFSGVF